MATALRDTPNHLSAIQHLQAEPFRFSLFAALRLIERVYADQPRLGESRRATTEAVRLAQLPHLSFAPTDVAAVTLNEQGRLLLETYSFGVLGPNGALPLHLTEVAYERLHQLADPTLSDFINIFQHRLLALFYRAWADADPATNHDRPHTDRFQLYLGALLGLGFKASRARDVVSDYAKFSRAAHFASQQRSPQGLESLLSDYFKLPVRVYCFVGDWLEIPVTGWSRIGVRNESAMLGVGTTLGSMVWHSQHKFELLIGPLALATANNFLPGTAGLRELAALVRLYTNDEWSWQLRLRMADGAVSPLRLGSDARLGWNTWLGTGKDCVTDVVIQSSVG